MEAENPVCSIKSSDLNSTIILFPELEIIFLTQLLCVYWDLGPKSGPDNLDININPSSYIKMKSPSASAMNCSSYEHNFKLGTENV